MERNKIIELFLTSEVIRKWHFFGFHFSFYHRQREHPFAASIVSLITELENRIPNAGLDYIDKIAAINDRKNETSHYDQLLQVLGELLIVHKAATYSWGDSFTLHYEPTKAGSAKNPELTINSAKFEIGIEVKTPQFVKKHNERATKNMQLPARSELIKGMNLADTMLPRDNPIKDFLLSADQKFLEFKKANNAFYSILCIVWDDFIYEPISALLSPNSGIFTPNSFAKDSESKNLLFNNVDCVIVTRHLLPIVRGSRGESLPDQAKHPLDYGRHEEFPFKVIIPNPNSKLTPADEVIDCFQVLTPGPLLGAEYIPSDIIHWFSN